jgi:HEAT repeat protein
MKRASPLADLEVTLATDRPRALAALRKALAAKKHDLIVEAVQRIGDRKVKELESELAAVFDHFASEGEDDDKRCAAKTAVVKALHQLGCDRSELFLCGVRCHRPTGFGRDDAAPLRIASANALAEFGHADAAEIMLELLTDEIADVRITAVRCLAAVAPHQAPMVLRLKALLGDESAPVIEECFSALLQTDARKAIPFVARFLEDADDDVRTSAAIALGESRQQMAFDALVARWQQDFDPDFRTTLLTAIAMLRQDYATRFLLSLIEEGTTGAADALLALAPYRAVDTIRQEVEAAVNKTQSKELRQLFDRKFRVS